MAKLTNCKDCGHKVSKKANVCPSCGVKNPSNRTHGFTKFLATLLCLFSVFCLFAAFGDHEPSQANHELNLKVYYAERTVEGLKKYLKDPSSAKLSGVLTVPYTRKDGSTSYVVCGEVNARNGFGGYTGYQSFVGVGELVLLEGTNGFSKVWNEVCVGKPGTDVTDYLN